MIVTNIIVLILKVEIISGVMFHSRHIPFFKVATNYVNVFISTRETAMLQFLKLQYQPL